jgi:2,4-dienoyl-CoA reductase-like NADH-dependent reductase (Old Yellow Enzyme family)
VGRALIANPDWAKKIKNNDMDSIETFHKKQLTALV